MLPPLRYGSIADVSPEFGTQAATRFGYERFDTFWQTVAENPEILAAVTESAARSGASVEVAPVRDDAATRQLEVVR